MNTKLFSLKFAKPPQLVLAIGGLGLASWLLIGGNLQAEPADKPAETFNPNYDQTADSPLRDAPIGPRVKLDLGSGSLDERVERVLAEMSLDEKIGQLCQVTASGDSVPERLAMNIRAGRVGSLFYTGSAKQIHAAQRIAREETRLGLPLLAPRDVIHGFRTVFPIPLGQAASWNPELVQQAATIAAAEAQAEGVNWTFAPMLDISRDARWGRIAESSGEDPVLGQAMATAVVRGYQGEKVNDHNESTFTGIAACAKHYVAYGLSEGGRDYNRAQVAISELHNVFLPPFRAATEANCLTVMTSFSTINGIPGTGHKQLLRGVLKDRWGFKGLVVSDWGSIVEMIPHGYAADERQAAERAINAGVDMEMVTLTYRKHLKELIAADEVKMKVLDQAVRRVLRVKLQIAFGETPTPLESTVETLTEKQKPTLESLAVARQLAQESVVLLKNDADLLPLTASKLKRIALIGPLQNASRDQLGCWTLDGEEDETQTVADALAEALAGQAKIERVAGLKSSVDFATDDFKQAVAAAKAADVAIVCVGEGWMLSGEARSRADLNLPGSQAELVRAIAATKTPVVMVVLAGRPLTIGKQVDQAAAVLYAWHPGTMGGPAIVDLLLGKANPSGKLPATFPKHVGQSPLYYNHPNTGRPPAANTRALIGSDLADYPDDQKYKSHYLDVEPFPLFPFGYGLSYTSFEYGKPEISSKTIAAGQMLGVRVRLTNTGDQTGEEIVQLYVQDVTASVVRPVRELKAFRRMKLKSGESTIVEFALAADALGYYDNEARFTLEPGKFRLGVGGDSTVPLSEEITLRGATIVRDRSPRKNQGDAVGASESASDLR